MTFLKSSKFFHALLILSLFLSGFVGITTKRVQERGNTLGVTTAADLSVPLSTTSYVDMALVTVAYRALTNPDATTVLTTTLPAASTYCGVALSPLAAGQARSKSTDLKQTTEILYALNPPTVDPTGGPCKTKINFTKDPEDRLISTTIIHNVPTSNWIERYNVAKNTSDDIVLTTIGPKDTITFCVYAADPSSGTNKINPVGTKWRQLWSSGYDSNSKRVESGLGATYQRTTDNEQIQIYWNGDKSLPWAATCMNLRVKPQAPSATPAPVPPSVNLKVNGSDGPLSLKPTDAMTISWTSSYAVSCIAAGGWSGVKATSGSETIPSFTGSKTFTINCVGADASQTTDSVTVSVVAPTATPTPAKVLKVDLMVNGNDGPITVAAGAPLKVSWSSQGATSCEVGSSGISGWSGTLGTSGSVDLTAASVGQLYSIICRGAWGLTRDTVTVVVTGRSPDNSVIIRADGSTGPNTLPAGSLLTVSWATLARSDSTFTGCTASGAWTGTKALSGSQNFTSVTAGNKTFTLTCAYKVTTGSGTYTYNAVSRVDVNVEAATATPPAAIKTGDRGWLERFYKSVATSSTTDANIFNSLKITRTKTGSFGISYDWGSTGTPDKDLIGFDYYAARWTAQMIPWKTGIYTLNVTKDDAARIKFGSTYLINSWTTSGRTSLSKTVSLVAGRPYDVTQEFFEKTSGSAFITGLGLPGENGPADVYLVASNNGIN